MPASTPLLDALKAEKSVQRDKVAIQRNHPQYKDAARASKKDDFQREGRGRPRCCFRGETKGQFNHAAWQMSREEGCAHAAPRRRPLRLASRRSRRLETHPLLHLWPTISVLSEQGQIRARQQASAQTTVHVTRSSRIDGPFIFVSPHRLWYLHCACTRTFPCASGL